MSNRFKDLKVEKKIKFGGIEVAIQKLSISRVLEIQEMAKTLDVEKDEMSNFKMLAFVVRSGCSEFSEMSDEEIFELPIDELSNLSRDIMKFSGMGNEK